jgi:hypothetical protein
MNSIDFLSPRRRSANRIVNWWLSANRSAALPRGSFKRSRFVPSWSSALRSRFGTFTRVEACGGSSVIRAFAVLLLVLLLAGCADRDGVRVQLHSRTPPTLGVMHLEVTAQVSGPDTGLRFKWFSVAGACNPQDSDKPTTLFKFADGATRDRVTVEIWRDGKVAAQNSIDVKLDEVQARLAAQEKIPGDLKIEINHVPPYEPQGGPNTHADIAGKVSGISDAGYSVVLYARASEVWYIQPLAYASHAIQPDNTWTSWTHTGSSYAALLVRPGFEPVPRLDVLPKIGGYVVARAIVDGARK